MPTFNVDVRWMEWSTAPLASGLFLLVSAQTKSRLGWLVNGIPACYDLRKIHYVLLLIFW